MIYLDNAASTKPSEQAVNAFLSALNKYGNPSSIHDKGLEARQAIEESSLVIAKRLGCAPDEVRYTSGATMGNNVAIQGYLRENPATQLIISTVEHDDIQLLADWVDCSGLYPPVKRIPVSRDGLVDLGELDDACREAVWQGNKVLCAIQYANSETGVIQDIPAIAKAIHRYYGVLLSDATQYIPWFPMDVHQDGVDMITMSGQKIHGLKGTGLLYVRKGVELSPLIFGEQGLIGGTENTYGIASLAAAFSALDYQTDEVKALRDGFVQRLRKVTNCYLLGGQAPRLPNNANICFCGKDAREIVQLLSVYGVCASTGSACSSQKRDGSPVAKAMGLSDADSKACVRFTLSADTTQGELDEAVQILSAILPLARKESDS